MARQSRQSRPGEGQWSGPSLPSPCQGQASTRKCCLQVLTELGGKNSHQTVPQGASYPLPPHGKGLILDYGSQRRVSPSSERALDDIQSKMQPFPSHWLPDPLPRLSEPQLADAEWDLLLHTSPSTAPAPAPCCSPGPGGWSAAATERAGMHLGIKNRPLVIALEPWAVPENLSVSAQGCWHRRGTSSLVNCVMAARSGEQTSHCTANHVYPKAATPPH